mgnify:CR=1 FL=1
MWYYKNGKLVVETDVVTGNYGTNDTPKVHIQLFTRHLLQHLC